MNDMPQMPETRGFVDIYRETQGSAQQQDLDCTDWLTMAAVGIACLAVIGAAGYAAYKWYTSDQEDVQPDHEGSYMESVLKAIKRE